MTPTTTTTPGETIERRTAEALDRIARGESTTHDELSRAYADAQRGPISIQINSAAAVMQLMEGEREIQVAIRNSVLAAVVPVLQRRITSDVLAGVQMQEVVRRATLDAQLEVRKAWTDLASRSTAGALTKEFKESHRQMVRTAMLEQARDIAREYAASGALHNMIETAITREVAPLLSGKIAEAVTQVLAQTAIGRHPARAVSYDAPHPLPPDNLTPGGFKFEQQTER